MISFDTDESLQNFGSYGFVDHEYKGLTNDMDSPSS